MGYSRILYLAQTDAGAEAVRRRYAREIVDAANILSPLGRRGDVVVVEPIPPSASARERERFEILLGQARTKCRHPEVPIIIGEIR